MEVNALRVSALKQWEQSITKEIELREDEIQQAEEESIQLHAKRDILIKAITRADLQAFKHLSSLQDGLNKTQKEIIDKDAEIEDLNEKLRVYCDITQFILDEIEHELSFEED